MPSIHDFSVSVFDHGELTSIGATALRFNGGASFSCRYGVEVQADIANGAAFIYLGNADVTAGGTDATDGFKLAAGARLFIPIDDVNKLYAIGSTTGLALSWIAY